MINLNLNESYINEYESIMDEVKYVSNALTRLKVLAALNVKPQNMKELTGRTKLSYSSISSTLHGLELKNLVYRESNRYYMTNSMKLQLQNILELKDILYLLNEFFNILDGHVVDVIPNESVAELYLLGKARLLESDGVNPYKIYDFMVNALKDAEKIQCILPFYYEDFNNSLNKLIDENKFVEAMVFEDVLEVYEENSNIKYLSSFCVENNFLLIVSDKIMILGFFKDDGYFDQNRLLTSKNSDSIIWAENLFKNFKNKNK